MNHIKNSFSTHQSPPKELLSSLLEHYQNGRFEEVENLRAIFSSRFMTAEKLENLEDVIPK